MLLMICLAAGWLYAAYDEANGQIKSIDVAGGKITVAVRQGRDAEPKEVTYLIDKDTTVRINREKKELTDLTEGKNVRIVFQEAAKAGDLPKALLITAFDRPAGGGGGGARRGGGGGGGN